MQVAERLAAIMQKNPRRSRSEQSVKETPEKDPTLTRSGRKKRPRQNSKKGSLDTVCTGAEDKTDHDHDEEDEDDAVICALHADMFHCPSCVWPASDS